MSTQPPRAGKEIGEGAAALAVAFAAALFATTCVLTRTGWPRCHEYLAHFERTEWFRRAFAARDLFPTWTPFSHHGHGSPGPLFYHRLFYSLSGALALFLGSTPRALRWALVVVLTLGGVGMARVGRLRSWPRALSPLAGLSLVLAPYTFTNWLVRGALAELSAAMLVPWLLGSLFALLAVAERRRAGRWSGICAGLELGVVCILLFYAHVVIWLYAGVLVLIAAAMCLVQAAATERRQVLVALLTATFVVVPCTLPNVLAVLRMQPFFSLERFQIFLPQNNFEPLVRYMWNADYTWGRSWQGLSVEIGLPLLIAAAALTAAILALRPSLRDRKGALCMAGLGFVCYGFLQLPLSGAFYRHTPFAELLQFPWRLLSLLTPLLLALCGELAAALWGTSTRRMALLVTGLGFAATQVGFAWHAQQLSYSWFSASDVRAVLEPLDGPWSAGEYLVAGMTPATTPAREPFLRLESCRLVRAPSALPLESPFHFLEMAFTVETEGERCLVHFSQFRTPLIAVEAGPDAAVLTSALRTTDVQFGPGVHTVRIHRRGLLELLTSSVH